MTDFSGSKGQDNRFRQGKQDNKLMAHLFLYWSKLIRTVVISALHKQKTEQ